jgi:hypothetical protein
VVLTTASSGVCQNGLASPANPLLNPKIVSAEREIQLLNPDGTLATDAKVVALFSAGGWVNQDLEPAKNAETATPPLTKLVNKNGTVTVDENTKAIVASNEHGFLFLPASANGNFGTKGKLRKWARVELDVSTVPEDQQANIAVNFVWVNSISGSYARPNLLSNQGPQTQFDWRFDPMINWIQSVPVKNHTVRVPPGELQITVASKQFDGQVTSYQDWAPGTFASNVGIWRVPSDTVQKIALPEFGTVEGLIGKVHPSSLPDWDASSGETVRIILHDASIASGPSKLLQPGANDEYASRLLSEPGLEERRRLTINSVTTSSNGKFRFPLVPAGKYSIVKLVENPGLSIISGQPSFRGVSLRLDGEAQSIVVNAKKKTSIEVHENTETNPIMPNFSQPTVQSPTSIGQDVAYQEHVRIVNGREERVRVPITIPRYSQSNNTLGASMNYGDPNSANSVPSPIGSSTVPYLPLGNAQELLSHKPDAAVTLIQNWIRTVQNPSDQTELRKLLQEHLQKEFEATQASRKAEIERLQKLLEKSVEWLDERARNRDEIIRKRMEELIRQSTPQSGNAPLVR